MREVNYDLNPSGRVAVLPEGGFRSTNWIVELNESFRVIHLDRIDDRETGVDGPSTERLEDCRAFRWRDAWWFTATCVLGDDPLLCKVALCRLEGSRIAERHLLPSPRNAPLEKNWIPLIRGERLELIYWIDPMEVIEYRGESDLSLRRIARWGRLEGWRGSSPVVRYRDNWLCVVHLRKDRHHSSSFEHRLIELDDDFTLRRMSRSFTFQGDDVEYCAGFCVTQTHAILSYGVWDREARLMRLELSAVEAMLRPLYIPRWLSICFLDAWRVARPWIRQPRKRLAAIVRRTAAEK